LGGFVNAALVTVITLGVFVEPEFTYQVGLYDRHRNCISAVRWSALGTLPKLAKFSFTVADNFYLHFFAIGSQSDSLNQPGVHHGKLI
jgi:hypothetical protein